MTAQETKEKITQLLEEIPEESLMLVPDYLREISALSAKELSAGQNLLKILQEDRNLLKRLAQ